MTSLPLSAKLQKLIARELEAGGYRSSEAMIVQALHALADRRQALEGIARGLADVKAGRVRSWKESKRDLLKRKPHLAGE
jgi:predicted transcriptional regulator